MHIDEAIKKFFIAPCDISVLPSEMQKTGERPLLYLIRRDLEKIYRKEQFLEPSQFDEHGPPFLACLGMMAGIDLIARFYIRLTRNGRRTHSGDIFKEFLRRIVKLKKREAEFLWAFRNSLAHSYGLTLEDSYSGDSVEVASGTQEGSWLTKRRRQRNRKKIWQYVVNLWELKSLFLHKVIPKARQVAENPENKTIQRRFLRRYIESGRIFTRSEIMRPPKAD